MNKSNILKKLHPRQNIPHNGASLKRMLEELEILLTDSRELEILLTDSNIDVFKNDFGLIWVL